jgi:hypothetical protein
MAKAPGTVTRLLRERLKNNVNVTMKQLAWNILSHARQLSMTDDNISKGTFLASWVIGIGEVNSWVAPTHFEPYSWEDGNEIRAQYASLVRQSYTASMQVTFSVPFMISNATPYLFKTINTNREYGGTNEAPLDGSSYASQLSSFARAEARRLFSSMPFDRMLYAGIAV